MSYPEAGEQSSPYELLVLLLKQNPYCVFTTKLFSIRLNVAEELLQSAINQLVAERFLTTIEVKKGDGSEMIYRWIPSKGKK